METRARKKLLLFDGKTDVTYNEMKTWKAVLFNIVRANQIYSYHLNEAVQVLKVFSILRCSYETTGNNSKSAAGRFCHVLKSISDFHREVFGNVEKFTNPKGPFGALLESNNRGFELLNQKATEHWEEHQKLEKTTEKAWKNCDMHIKKREKLRTRLSKTLTAEEIEDDKAYCNLTRKYEKFLSKYNTIFETEAFQRVVLVEQTSFIKTEFLKEEEEKLDAMFTFINDAFGRLGELIPRGISDIRDIDYEPEVVNIRAMAKAGLEARLWNHTFPIYQGTKGFQGGNEGEGIDLYSDDDELDFDVQEEAKVRDARLEMTPDPSTYFKPIVEVKVYQEDNIIDVCQNTCADVDTKPQRVTSPKDTNVQQETIVSREPSLRPQDRSFYKVSLETSSVMTQASRGTSLPRTSSGKNMTHDRLEQRSQTQDDSQSKRSKSLDAVDPDIQKNPTQPPPVNELHSQMADSSKDEKTNGDQTPKDYESINEVKIHADPQHEPEDNGDSKLKITVETDSKSNTHKYTRATDREADDTQQREDPFRVPSHKEVILEHKRVQAQREPGSRQQSSSKIKSFHSDTEVTRSEPDCERLPTAVNTASRDHEQKATSSENVHISSSVGASPEHESNILATRDRSESPERDASSCDGSTGFVVHTGNENVALMSGVTVYAHVDRKKKNSKEISIRKGMKIKQIRCANQDGMAYGYKKIRLGFRKYGVYPASAVSLSDRAESPGESI